MPCGLRKLISRNLSDKNGKVNKALSVRVIVYTSEYKMNFSKTNIIRSRRFSDTELLIAKKDVIKCD